MQPYGGTEIQLEYLHKYVSKELLNKVEITTSIPEKTPIDSTKVNVLWVHNSYDQPNLMPWFQNKLNHGKYDYCLLYTSPSPRDGLLSRMPSSA